MYPVNVYLLLQKALNNDQIRESEMTVQSLVEARHAIFAQQTPLVLAKEVQGLRAIFEEVCACMGRMYIV